MSKFGVTKDALDTLKKWVPGLLNLNFEDNHKGDVLIADKAEGDLLIWNNSEKRWENKQLASAAAVTIDASQVVSGTFADARIAQSNVTQHQAALTLAASQITSGTLADARISETSVHQHLGLYRFFARRNGNQSRNSGSWQRVLCDTEVYDDDARHSVSTGQYSCPVTGLYLFGGTITWDDVTLTGFRGARIYNLTSSKRLCQTFVPAVQTEDTAINVSTIIECAASDQIQLQQYQDSGSNINLIGEIDYSTNFHGCCLRVGGL